MDFSLLLAGNCIDVVGFFVLAAQRRGKIQPLAFKVGKGLVIRGVSLI